MRFMRTNRIILPAALATCLAIFPMHATRAVTPTELQLKESGEILVKTDGLPDLQIRTEVKDVSTGQWKNTSAVPKCVPSAGSSVERVQTSVFPDGSEVAHTVNAKIDGAAVNVAASWVPTGNPPGFSRVDLWIPENLAREITVTIGDTQVFPFPEGQVIKTYETRGPMVVKRRSNDEFLLQLSGDFVSATPSYYPSIPNNGLTLRLLNVPNDTTAKIGDNTQLNWSLSFKEQ